MGRVDALREWYRRIPLQTRFALHIILLVSVLFAILIPSVLLIQESAILGMAQDNGLSLVTTFAFSSVQTLVADDFLGLRQLVNSLTRNEDTRYAMILDLDGRVLIHSRANETGRIYRDPLTLRALKSTSPLVQEIRGRDGEIVYDFAAPVLVLNQRRAVARLGVSIGDELRLIRRTRNTILGLGILTLITGLVWAHLQARRLTRPIQALARGATAVAGGDLGHRIPVDRRDEVGHLAEAFNTMAESLRVRFEVDRELSSTLNLQIVLETLVRHAQNLSGADVAFLAYRDREAPTAVVAACSGTVGTTIRSWGIRPGQGRAGFVLSGGGISASPQAASGNDPEEERVLREEGVLAMLLVPIRLRHICVGVLGVGQRREVTFAEGTEEALQRLADQAAVALANALAYREIEMLNLSLEAKVAERTRELSDANTALEVSHRKLQALDRLKSEFVSNVSHELRTPLTAIRMSVDNLLDGITGEIGPVLERYLTKVRNNTDRLVRLITDLLDLSRIEAGRVELHPTLVAVDEIIREVADGLRPMAAGKGLELVVATSDEPLLTRADRDKLQQILINLTENAAKFTPSGGRITLTARQGSEIEGQGSRRCQELPPALAMAPDVRFLEVAVEDTGEGIPTDELTAIFEKFHQVRREGHGKAQGTGLGLAIVKSLIELHGGRIWVDSQVGRGSRFVFALPMVESATVADAPKDIRSQP